MLLFKNSSSSLTTNTGNINVNKAYLTTSVKTNNGDINIAFAEDAESFKTNSNSRKIIGELRNGKINVIGAENITLTIKDKARANINMKDVCGTNSISGKHGEVNVVINKDSVYTLTTSSTAGNVRVNLTQISEYKGYTTKENRITNVNCVNSTNTFAVTTENGNLTILDTNLI